MTNALIYFTCDVRPAVLDRTGDDRARDEPLPKPEQGLRLRLVDGEPIDRQLIDMISQLAGTQSEGMRAAAKQGHGFDSVLDASDELARTVSEHRGSLLGFEIRMEVQLPRPASKPRTPDDLDAGREMNEGDLEA